MKPIIQKTIESTNGYKTKAAALVYLLVVVFGNKVPFITDHQEAITASLNILIGSGLLHDFWRNKSKILEWIKNVIKKDKNN